MNATDKDWLAYTSRLLDESERQNKDCGETDASKSDRRGLFADLKRDISAFELAFQALLKALKYLEADEYDGEEDKRKHFEAPKERTSDQAGSSARFYVKTEDFVADQAVFSTKSSAGQALAALTPMSQNGFGYQGFGVGSMQFPPTPVLHSQSDQTGRFSHQLATAEQLGDCSVNLSSPVMTSSIMSHSTMTNAESSRRSGRVSTRNSVRKSPTGGMARSSTSESLASVQVEGALNERNMHRDKRARELKTSRILRLDGVWVDMLREHEDEANAFIEKNRSRVANMKVHQGRRGNSTHRNFSICPDFTSFVPDTIVPVMKPDSETKIVWDSIGFAFLTCDLVTIPVQLAFDLATLDGFFFQTRLIYWTVDFILSFNTGYYSHDVVVENRVKIFRNYVRGWFLFDLLLVSIDYSKLALRDSTALRALQSFRGVRLLRLLRIVKLSKISNAVKTTLTVKRNWFLNTLLAIIWVVVLNVFCGAHFMACVWRYMGQQSIKHGEPSWLIAAGIDNDNLSTQYLVSIHWVLAQVTPAPINIHPQNNSERICTVCVILFSLFVFGGSLAKLRSTLDSLSRQCADKDLKKRQLALYLHHCEASVDLTARIVRYAERQLGMKEKLITEAPPGLVSKALMSELLANLRKPILVQHPLFRFLDGSLSQQEEIVSRISCEAFASTSYDEKQTVFVRNTLATSMLFMKTGTYELKSTRLRECKAFNHPHEQQWFAEVCLFIRHIHSSTLTTTSFSEAFSLPRDNLLSCIRNTPIVIVSICEYARDFLNGVASHIEPTGTTVPDYLPHEISVQACEDIELGLLHGDQIGKSGWEKMRDSICESLPIAAEAAKEAGAEDFLNDVLEMTIEPEQIHDFIRQAFPELGNSGAFEAFAHGTECSRVIAAIGSAVLLIINQYEAFVRSQDSSLRLSYQLWSEFQNLVHVTFPNVIDSSMAHAIFVFLLLRGLVKSTSFAEVCAPRARASRARMVKHCLVDEGFQRILPSILLLNEEQRGLINSMCDIEDKFNMPQFLQGENVPFSIGRLKTHLLDGNAAAFRPYLFSQVCVMCGLKGDINAEGSLFMTSPEAVPLLLALRHIQNIEKEHPANIYYSYLIERSNHVGLTVHGSEALAFSRLICLSRTVDFENLRPLRDAWRNLSRDDKVVLTSHLVSDGIEEYTIIILFLPLYLTNALKNKSVGMLRALRILVEILNLLYSRRPDADSSDAPIATADIHNLAVFTEKVLSSQVFEECVEYMRLSKESGKVAVIIEDHRRPPDLREQVTQIHRTVKQIAGGQAKAFSLLTQLGENANKHGDSHLHLLDHEQMLSRTESDFII